MKILLIILLCFSVFYISCVNPSSNKSEASNNDNILTNEETKEINKIQQSEPFNYAIANQRTRYKPFLYGAQGWIYPVEYYHRRMWRHIIFKKDKNCLPIAYAYKLRKL